MSPALPKIRFNTFPVPLQEGRARPRMKKARLSPSLCRLEELLLVAACGMAGNLLLLGLNKRAAV